MNVDTVVKARAGGAAVIEVTWTSESDALDVIDLAASEARKEILSRREQGNRREASQWNAALPHA